MLNCHFTELNLDTFIYELGFYSKSSKFCTNVYAANNFVGKTAEHAPNVIVCIVYGTPFICWSGMNMRNKRNESFDGRGTAWLT